MQNKLVLFCIVEMQLILLKDNANRAENEINNLFFGVM